MSNSLNPDQGQHIVGPDPGPIFLKRLAIDDRKSSLASKGLTTNLLLKQNIDFMLKMKNKTKNVVFALLIFICW